MNSLQSKSYHFLKNVLSAPFSKLNNVWKNGRVLSISARDPRWHSDVVVESDNIINDIKTLAWPKQSDESLIWHKSELCQVNSSFRSDHQLNTSKNKRKKVRWSSVFSKLTNATNNSTGEVDIVPESTLSKNLSAEIPILLIRHRSGKYDGTASKCINGWSLILPSSYSMVFWRSLIQRNAVAVGYEEINHIQRATGVLSFPNDFLDCKIGWQHWLAGLDSLKRKSYLRRVEAIAVERILHARVDFIAESIQPASGSDIQEAKIAVVRNYAYLSAFNPQQAINAKDIQGQNWMLHANGHSDWNLDNYEEHEKLQTLPPTPHPTYVHVMIDPISRGQPLTFCAVYIPNTEDIKKITAHILTMKQKTSGDKPSKRKKWSGVLLENTNDAQRQLLGYVTSGAGVNGSNERKALVICDAAKLYVMMSRNFLRFNNPLSHKLVLFHNIQSNWLRPANFEFL